MLLLTEIALRVSGKFSTTVINYRYSPDLLGDFAPNQDVIDTSIPSLAQRVTFNSQGYRGELVEIPKPSGTIRILALGDSFTQSARVKDNETWPFQLQGKLRELFPDKKIEVVNTGKSGYTIIDEVAYYKEKGYKFNPDIVIVGFTASNDIRDLSRPLSSREYSKKLSSWEGESFFGPIARYFRQTAMFNLVYEAKVILEVKFKRNIGPVGVADTMSDIDPEAVFKEEENPEIQKLWDKYFTSALNFKGELAEKDKKLMFFLFPGVGQLKKERSYIPQKRMKIFARENEILMLDLAPIYEKESLNDLYLLPLDRHPSPKAYALTADALAKFIKENDIIKTDDIVENDEIIKEDDIGPTAQ